jgi:hypothetical protein
MERLNPREGQETPPVPPQLDVDDDELDVDDDELELDDDDDEDVTEEEAERADGA